MTVLNSYGLIPDGHLLNFGQLADMVIYLGVRSSCVHIGLGWFWWEPESEHTCGNISLALHLNVTSTNETSMASTQAADSSLFFCLFFHCMPFCSRHILPAFPWLCRKTQKLFTLLQLSSLLHRLTFAQGHCRWRCCWHHLQLSQLSSMLLLVWVFLTQPVSLTIAHWFKST